MKIKGFSNILVVTLLLGFLFSCSDRPSNVLSEDKMVSLMVDMEITEAYVNTQMASSSKEKLEMGQRVLEQHGFSKETLDTTLACYGRNIDEYSELFEKVDKEILKRKQRYTEIPGETNKVLDNLWPYNQHLMISPLSEDESFVFSIPEPKVNKGDILKFSFFLPNATGVKGYLGVEYEEGYGESTVSNVNQKNKFEMELHTDTAKTVSRLFGVMNFKDQPRLPLYIDSISINVEPYDSLTYHNKRRILKSYGILRPQKPKIEETKDSINF